MTVDLHHYLILSGLVCSGSIVGVLFHRTVVSYRVGILFFAQAITLNFIAFSKYVSSDLSGHVFSLMMLIIISLMIGLIYE